MTPSIELPPHILDAGQRQTGSLPNAVVSHYEELNARLGWQVAGSCQSASSHPNVRHARHRGLAVPPGDAIGRGVVPEARRRF